MLQPMQREYTIALAQMCMMVDNNVYKSNWQPYRNELINFLSDELDYSDISTLKQVIMLSIRPGGINFSILGRGKDSMEI